MDEATNRQLAITATRVRMGIIEGVYHAKSGHPGGSLSMTDILTYLYFKEMKVDSKNPKDPDRDRFVLSKGHCAPALYSVLAHKGYFPVETLSSLRKLDSFLQGHPDMKGVNGVDMSSGSLGQGISAAVGMALAGHMDQKPYRVYSVLGDGELQEGQVWEAAMFASAKKLSNLTAFVDNNNLQIDGTIVEVNSPYPIGEKFTAFGWHVIEIDGHNFKAIASALNEARTINDRPTMIVAKTVKGKGVSFMENDFGWHGKAPNQAQYEQAMQELRSTLSELEGKNNG